MTKHRKKFTNRQLAERAKLESELSAIPPLNPAIKKLTSSDGFADYPTTIYECGTYMIPSRRLTSD